MLAPGCTTYHQKWCRPFWCTVHLTLADLPFDFESHTMRCFGIALISLAACGSTAWSAPADPQQTSEQQQIIQAQQADDQIRQPTAEMIHKYQPLHNRYGSISGLRIAMDRMAQLDEARDARAVRYWTLMNLQLPLREPLSEAQRADLETFIGAFGTSPQTAVARRVLTENEKVVEAFAAGQLLDKLQLLTTSDVLSAEQLKGLEEIDTKYPNSPAAAIGKQFLRAHYNRQSQEEAKIDGLIPPNKAEQLASRRLGEVRGRLGTRHDKVPFRQALADLIEDYPDTLAARDAAAQLVNVQREIEATIANSKFINEYWDAQYPSRTMKPSTDNFYHN